MDGLPRPRAPGRSLERRPSSHEARLPRPPAIEDLALRSLAAQLGLPRRRVKSAVLELWMHPWHEDPYSRGAYSYAKVGGSEAGRRLSRPVEGTLFLAGEAFDRKDGSAPSKEPSRAASRRPGGQ